MRFQSVLTSIIALTFATSAFAQDTTTKNVLKTQDVAPQVSMLSIEPVVGAVSSTFTNVVAEGTAKIESVPGGLAGLNFIVGQDDLQLEAGLALASRGSKVTNISTSSGKLSVEFTNKYLDIPLLGRYTFMDDGQFRLFVKGGVVVGLLQSSEAKGTLGSQTANSDFKSYFNGTDARFAMSVGSSVRISNKMHLIGSLDYQHSMSKVNTDKFQEDLDMRITSYGLAVGLGFEI